MILHELAHKTQAHSLDILFLELVTIFHWFNPLIYLFKRLVQANHEYLADEFVLRSGVSVSDYSDKIINHTFKVKRTALVSGFSKMLVKRRLKLLAKFKQKKSPFFRLLAFAPISSLLFITTAFSISSEPLRGTFSANVIRWSAEKEIRMEGNLKVQFGRNDFTGEGSFSGFDKGTLLIVDGKRVALDESINISEQQCNLLILSKVQAKSKYKTDGNLGAVEVYTSR
ncbi:hypothetical protein LZD49_34815 [Dyadobacter sp. CY261]|nr:hypothetical protein [Dyadobacter sp. CY261]